MLHYWLPLSPSSASRFDPDLWQAYVKANKVEAVSSISTAQTGAEQCMQLAWPLLLSRHLSALETCLNTLHACPPALSSFVSNASQINGFMQIFSDKLVEVISMDDDFVWIHDYHLLVLPSLLRKRFHRLRCGLFLHSPFPSSEIWRTFPKREELLRSLLNVDLIGD